jgi:hypothetical protein
MNISLQGLYCSCKPVFCSHVTLTGYLLHSLVSPLLLLSCVTVCHHISKAVYLKCSHFAKDLPSKPRIEGRIEGRLEVTSRRERKRKKLLDDCKETRGCWKLKENALSRALWKARFCRSLGEDMEKIYTKIFTCKCLVMSIVSYIAGL